MASGLLTLAPGQRKYLPSNFVNKKDWNRNVQIEHEKNLEFLGLWNLNPNIARNSMQIAKEVRNINYFMKEGNSIGNGINYHSMKKIFICNKWIIKGFKVI